MFQFSIDILQSIGILCLAVSMLTHIRKGRR